MQTTIAAVMAAAERITATENFGISGLPGASRFFFALGEKLS